MLAFWFTPAAHSITVNLDKINFFKILVLGDTCGYPDEQFDVCSLWIIATALLCRHIFDQQITVGATAFHVKQQQLHVQFA